MPESFDEILDRVKMTAGLGMVPKTTDLDELRRLYWEMRRTGGSHEEADGSGDAHRRDGAADR